MNLCWFLLFTISSSIVSMDLESGSSFSTPNSSEPPSLSRRSDHNDDELAQIAFSFYFNQEDADVYIQNKVFPKVSREIDKLRSSLDYKQMNLRKDLHALKSRLRHETRHRGHSYWEANNMHGEYAHLHAYISGLVADAIKESFREAEQEAERLQRNIDRQARQKKIAMALGAITTLISTGAALLVHFTEAASPQQ